jgi:hypothetical protein
MLRLKALGAVSIDADGRTVGGADRAVAQLRSGASSGALVRTADDELCAATLAALLASLARHRRAGAQLDGLDTLLQEGLSSSLVNVASLITARLRQQGGNAAEALANVRRRP